jgi:hypothetical protein
LPELVEDVPVDAGEPTVDVSADVTEPEPAS